MTEIQRQVARNTSILEDLSVSGPQPSLISFFIQELDTTRKRFDDVWSAATEINLQGAKLYLFAHSLLLTDIREVGTRKGSNTNHFVATMLQQGYGAALDLIKVIEDLGFASTTNPPCTSKENGGAPLLAHPKQHFRLAFFACEFLLKYLDSNPTTCSTDQDAARNAVSTVYQVFKQFLSMEEVLRAAHTIEVLGRSVVPGQKRIKTMVRTRMGASLNFDVIWLAAKLRGREHDPEFTLNASTSKEPGDSYPGVSVSKNLGNTTVENGPPITSAPFSSEFSECFPWGIWDDAVYDELRLGLDHQPFSDFPNLLDNF